MAAKVKSVVQKDGGGGRIFVNPLACPQENLGTPDDQVGDGGN